MLWFFLRREHGNRSMDALTIVAAHTRDVRLRTKVHRTLSHDMHAATYVDDLRLRRRGDFLRARAAMRIWKHPRRARPRYNSWVRRRRRTDETPMIFFISI